MSSAVRYAALTLAWMSAWLAVPAIASSGGPDASDSPSLDVPSPDLASVEAPVRELVEQRRRAVLDEPGSADHWGRLGMALDIHGFDDAAERSYRRALELEPDAFPWAYYRAMVLAELADPAAADAFEAAIARRPDYSPLLIRSADLLLDLGRVADAERRYRRAIDADGDGLAHAHLGLARLALAAGELTAALASAEQATAADPDLADAWGLLAEIHRRRGDADDAAEARRMAQEIRGPTVLVDAHVAALMEDGRSSYWHHERGQFLLASRRPAAAEAEVRIALELSPHALFYQTLARTLLAQQRPADAQIALERSVELAPTLATSHLLLGRLYADAERRAAAIDALRRAAELRPDLAARDLGYQLMAADERREGARWLERALDAEEDRRVLLTLAFYYSTTPGEGQRDPLRAERYARRLLELAADRPEAWDVLGTALAAQGRFDGAVDAAGRALELAAGLGSPLVRRIQQRLALYRAGRPFVSDR